ncbi:hypothetical protein BJ878DRAFT_515694, partial [Calycina marina]
MRIKAEQFAVFFRSRHSGAFAKLKSRTFAKSLFAHFQISILTSPLLLSPLEIAMAKEAHTQTPLEELNAVFTLLLNPCHHRNKNQHRVAKWWKPFCMLRRHVQKLIIRLDDLAESEKFAGGKENAYVRRSHARVEEEARWSMGWSERCYVAFTAIVADMQYANLGLMLIGALAQVRRVVSSLLPEEEYDEDDEDDANDAIVAGEVPHVITGEGLDFGEVIKRGSVQTSGRGDVVSEDEDLPIKRSTKKRNHTEVSVEIEASGVAKATKEEKKDRKKRRKAGKNAGITVND